MNHRFWSETFLTSPPGEILATHREEYCFGTLLIQFSVSRRFNRLIFKPNCSVLLFEKVFYHVFSYCQKNFAKFYLHNFPGSYWFTRAIENV